MMSRHRDQNTEPVSIVLYASRILALPSILSPFNPLSLFPLPSDAPSTPIPPRFPSICYDKRYQFLYASGILALLSLNLLPSPILPLPAPSLNRNISSTGSSYCSLPLLLQLFICSSSYLERFYLYRINRSFISY